MTPRRRYSPARRRCAASSSTNRASCFDGDLSRWLDDVTKVVFSRTLREVTWKNARLAKRDAADEVAALKRATGKHIVLQNRTRLAQTLLAAGLVDELQIIVAPVALGGGRALFAGLPQRLELGAVELSRFEDGPVFVRHEVKPR